MNFYESFYGLTSLLPESERRKTNTAILDYFFEGKEPSGLSSQGMKVFEGCRGRIDASIRGRENVTKRYENNPTTYTTKQSTTYPTTYSTKSTSTYDTDRERDRDIERDKGKSSAKRAKFIPPSVDQVESYIAEKGYSVDAQSFVDFYDSKGWLVGKSPMKDWKAAVRTWNRREKKKEVHNGLEDFAEYLS